MDQEQKEVRQRRIIVLVIIAYVVITSLLGADFNVSDQYRGY
jgi:hypothetical protein